MCPFHRRFVLASCVAAIALAAGCEISTSPAPPPSKPKTAARPRPAGGNPPATTPPTFARNGSGTDTSPPAGGNRLNDPRTGPRTLEDLLNAPDQPVGAPDGTARPPAIVDARGVPNIDEAKVAAAGIRRLEGTHLVLFTDLPAAPEVDELPAVFDAAVPGWCGYFGVDAAKAASWRLTAYLIQDKNRFRGAGLFPDDLPPFLHGYQRSYELWMYEQPSAYYRRHLLLHEGTHGFMYTQFGSAGPPWYMEGTAEIFGTHLWSQGRLTLGHFPRTRDEAPHWGRVKIVQDDFANGRGLLLENVMQYDHQAHLRLEPYGWCWAACAFLDAHPRYQGPFREQVKQLHKAEGEFNSVLLAALRPRWREVAEEWQLFIVEMEYGYDVARAAVDYKPGQPLPAGGASATISADRGWQSTGVLIEAGTTYEITASGRYQVADEPRAWWCEPNGITLHYYRGQPLGMLMGALRSDTDAPAGLSPLAFPAPLGLARTFRPDTSGTLYVRINESPAGLRDNDGTLAVRVVKK